MEVDENKNILLKHKTVNPSKF